MYYWKIFLHHNRHVRHFFLKTLWILTDEKIGELLRELANMTDLEILEISIRGLMDHHVRLIGTVIQNLKVLKVEFDILAEITEDIKQIFDANNIQLIGNNFGSLSPEFDLEANPNKIFEIK